jgi:hypothetical protein
MGFKPYHDDTLITLERVVSDQWVTVRKNDVCLIKWPSKGKDCSAFLIGFGMARNHPLRKTSELAKLYHTQRLSEWQRDERAKAKEQSA